MTTDVPGCREVVREGENGWLVPARDASALATCLQEALARPDLRAIYGARGRKKIEEEFSLNRVTAETLAVYREFNNAH